MIVLLSLLTLLKWTNTIILVSKALLVNTLYKLIQWMIGTCLVLSMIWQLEPADLDLDQLVPEMVLVDHINNSLILFRDHYIGKQCVLFICCHFTFSIFQGFFISCFSGSIKGHGLKYQNILFPSGMAAGIFGTSMSHNDVGVLNTSNLTHYLEDILHPNHITAVGLWPAA